MAGSWRASSTMTGTMASSMPSSRRVLRWSTMRSRARTPSTAALATVMPEVFATYLDVRERELALVAVALGLADPRDPADAAARVAIEGIEAFLRSVGQRRTLAEQGLGPETHETIAQDSVDDAAINNSPRLPSKPEILAILAAVAGG